MYLAGNTAGGISAHQFLYFFNSNLVKVAVDGVLEARGGSSKAQGFFVVAGVSQQAINKATHKGVAAAYTVHNVGNLIGGCSVQIFTVVQHARPGIVVGTYRTAQGGNYLFNPGKAGHDLLGNTAVGFGLYMSAGHIYALGFYAQDHLRIFLVTQYYVTTCHQVGHHFIGALAVLPQVFAVVEVGRYRNTFFVGYSNGLLEHIGSTLRNSRGDAGPVEPRGAFKNLFPIELAWFYFGKRRMGMVVHHLAGAGYSTRLQEIDAQAFAAKGNVAGVYAVFVQFHVTGASDVVFRQSR